MSKEEGKKIKAAFRAADLNSDTTITRDELWVAFHKLGEWSEAEFDVLFKAADVNENGTLDFNEFVDWVMDTRIDVDRASMFVTKWMVHQRDDHIPRTSLRVEPTDAPNYVQESGAKVCIENGAAVQVIATSRGYAQIYAVEHLGWVKEAYLHSLPQMLHKRDDDIPKTSLRLGAFDDSEFVRGFNLLNDEVVEVIYKGDEFSKVHVATACTIGWIKTKYLHDMSGLGSCPRWMVHKRPDAVSETALRYHPSDSEEYIDSAYAMNDEVVEVLDSEGDYCRVRLALSGASGWVKQTYLQACPEGTRDHGRLSIEGGATRLELDAHHFRFREVQRFLRDCNDHRPPDEIDAERVWFISGHFLGETGMVTGPKETLFHGLKDAAVDSIVNGGFDDAFASAAGAFGAAMYFSPQSCKAYTYAENYMLVCEVALGKEENRLTVTEGDHTLTYKSVMSRGMRSVQAMAGCPFTHNERMVYHPCQCKPVYLVKLTKHGPGGEGKPGGKCP